MTKKGAVTINILSLTKLPLFDDYLYFGSGPSGGDAHPPLWSHTWLYCLFAIKVAVIRKVDDITQIIYISESLSLSHKEQVDSAISVWRHQLKTPTLVVYFTPPSYTVRLVL